MIRTGSRSFYLAGSLLPPDTRKAAHALYAFCRITDDAVDLTDGDRYVVARLSARLDRIYSGSPADHPADRAFGRVVEQYRIPRALPDALLEGMAWDADCRRYETFPDLVSYAVRVAGTVGLMMTLIMGERRPAILARAGELGIAMQLTNIARDVGEDAAAGRLYLPRAWFRGCGLDPDAWLCDPVFNRDVAAMTARLLRHARLAYARASPGIAALPASCRPAIRAASRIYAEIGSAIERNRFDSVSSRAVVGRSRKVALLAQALTPDRRHAKPRPFVPDADTAKLIATVPRGPRAGSANPVQTDPGSVDDRIASVMGLFVRLGHRDLMHRRSPT